MREQVLGQRYGEAFISYARENIGVDAAVEELRSMVQKCDGDDAAFPISTLNELIGTYALTLDSISNYRKAIIESWDIVYGNPFPRTSEQIKSQ